MADLNQIINTSIDKEDAIKNRLTDKSTWEYEQPQVVLFQTSYCRRGTYTQQNKCLDKTNDIDLRRPVFLFSKRAKVQQITEFLS